MIRLGIVDFDTSHVVAFTQRLHHQGVPEEQWVEGARVVMGCPGTSALLPAEKVAEYARAAEGLGVRLVERPEAMLGEIDAVLIESNDGTVHLARARPFLEAGVPTFIDKPFACSLSDAREIARLARAKGVPIFSSSSLRFAPEVTAGRESPGGALLGLEVWSPGTVNEKNPGLFNYGVHGVEPLYALMGQGCEVVTCHSTEGVDVATGRWRDGRIASVRALRAGRTGFGLTAYRENAIESMTIGTEFIYRELLRRIVAMFQTGQPPIPIEESLEIVAFMEAALQSAREGGKPVALSAIEV